MNLRQHDTKINHVLLTQGRMRGLAGVDPELLILRPRLRRPTHLVKNALAEEE